MAESARQLNLEGSAVAENYVEAIRWHPLITASRLQIRNPDHAGF